MTDLVNYTFFCFPMRILINVACNTDTMQSNKRQRPRPPMPLKICPGLNAHRHHFTIRSNAFGIVIISLAICCQPTSLFLTTSQAGGIAMGSNGVESTLGRLCENVRNLRDLQPKLSQITS